MTAFPTIRQSQIEKQQQATAPANKRRRSQFSSNGRGVEEARVPLASTR